MNDTTPVGRYPGGIAAVVLTRATHAFCKILNHTLKGVAVKWTWTFSGTFAIMLAVSR
ncbi:MAG: hypothetical protein ACKO9F_08675 [Caldilinea sp.]